MQVKNIPYEAVDSVVDTLHEAFYDYPVMRYVLGGDASELSSQHLQLTRLFVMARVYCNEPLLGIGELPELAAAAVVSLPETEGTPKALADFRKQVWSSLPEATKSRYDVYVAACEPFDIKMPHHHLNMVGVRDAYRGSGLGRQLVEHVIQLAEQHPNSNGVSLTTETPGNVPFYQHLGFEVTGHAKVGSEMETWSFFKEI
ncbi:MAG TPA: GNAT family N-acetyltransferase [Xanthomonadales bacterium]|nr:GNAT family N-acetyltransferase [Xanthomonadales bacterium]